MNQHQTSLANKILTKHGTEPQIEMAIEEMAELILALQKLKRGHRNPVRVQEFRDQVINELADVTIMVEQLKFIFDNRRVEEQITYKLNREIERMNLHP